MLYTEIISVCSEIHTNHINTLQGDLEKNLKGSMQQVTHVQSIRQNTWHWQAHSLYGNVAVRHLAQQANYHCWDPAATGTFHKRGQHGGNRHAAAYTFKKTIVATSAGELRKLILNTSMDFQSLLTMCYWFHRIVASFVFTIFHCKSGFGQSGTIITKSVTLCIVINIWKRFT
jgi:hypothetical protein